MAKRRVAGLVITEFVPETEREEPGGSHDSKWAKAEVLVKSNNVDHRNIVVNEFIANRIAMALGVPTPMGDLWLDTETEEYEFRWVSAEIRARGVGLPPPALSYLQKLPSRAPGVLELIYAFDALINNQDRSLENFLYREPNAIWAIDHDLCLFQDSSEEGASRFLKDGTAKSYYDPGGLWKKVPLSPAVIEIVCMKIKSSLGEYEISGPVNHLQDLKVIDQGVGSEIVSFLTYRRDNLVDIALGKHAVFQQPEIPMEGLFEQEVELNVNRHLPREIPEGSH